MSSIFDLIEILLSPSVGEFMLFYIPCNEYIGILSLASGNFCYNWWATFMWIIHITNLSCKRNIGVWWTIQPSCPLLETAISCVYCWKFLKTGILMYRLCQWLHLIILLLRRTNYLKKPIAWLLHWNSFLSFFSTFFVPLSFCTMGKLAIQTRSTWSALLDFIWCFFLLVEK